MDEAPYGPLLTIAVAPAERPPSWVSPRARAVRFDAMVRELMAIIAANRALTLDVDPGLMAQLGGPDEASLDRAVDVLKASCDVDVGAPQVSYREAVCSTVEIDRTLKRSGLFARVRLRVALGTGGFTVDPCLPGGLPPALLAGAVAGLMEAARAGTLAGFPIAATLVTLLDGAWHETDTTPDAFAEVTRDALRGALRQAGRLLEPVMRVEAVAPEDYEGALVGDFTSRGEVVAREGRGSDVAVTGLVALANMLGYASDLRRLTQGRGHFTSRFALYRPVPRGGGDDPPPAAEAALRA